MSYQPKEVLSINKNLFLFIKIETNGFPIMKAGYNAKYYSYNDLTKYNNSRIVRISWGTYTFKKVNKSIHNYIIKPNGFNITNSNIHGITENEANTNGEDIENVFNILKNDLKDVKFIVGHSLDFITNILYSELHRLNKINIIESLKQKEQICTSNQSVNILKIPLNNDANKYKTPKFSELYKYCFNIDFDSNNNDGETYIEALMQCFFHLIK